MEYEVEVIIRSKRIQEHTASITSNDEASYTIRSSAVSVDALESLITSVENKLIPVVNAELTA